MINSAQPVMQEQIPPEIERQPFGISYPAIIQEFLPTALADTDYECERALFRPHPCSNPIAFKRRASESFASWPLYELESYVAKNQVFPDGKLDLDSSNIASV
jgi:hypothetical protein